MPYWFHGAGGPQANPNHQNTNPSTQNQAPNPFQFGTFPNNPALNAQNGAMGWPNAFAYGQYGPPPPFGFMQGPPPMFYGRFPLATQPGPSNGPAATPSTERADADSVAGPPHRIAGRPRWRSPSPRRDERHRDEESDTSDDYPRSKGKRRATEQELERRRQTEDRRRQREEHLEEERQTERARQCVEREPIPQHVLALQEKETRHSWSPREPWHEMERARRVSIPQRTIDMQERDVRSNQGPSNDSTTSALHHQLSLNLELMKKCNELEKMVNKWQLSPSGQGGNPVKRQQESHTSQAEHRRRVNREYDEFLQEDQGDTTPRRPSWNERERGRGGPTRGREPTQSTRTGKGISAQNNRAKPTTESSAPVPRHVQHLRDEDRHDEVLDCYDQRRFGGIIPDERVSLEERIADLSTNLPAMPLANGSYPIRAPDDRPVADIIEGVGPSRENPTNGLRSLNSVQTARLFVERCAKRLRHPGRLPAWLNNFKTKEVFERDNSFRGMYGPGFTYDPRTNIVYTDREAVDAAGAMAAGLDYPTPSDIARQPNPRGFPMNIREVQESIQDNGKQFSRSQRRAIGASERHAGRLVPVRGTPLPTGRAQPSRGADYGCFTPRQLREYMGNGPLTFAPPHRRYLAGIAFRPQFYSDYIRRWNRDRPEELPIVVATENISELNVVRHLAACGITQEMIDNAYPWAMVWIDQRTNVHFRAHYQDLELERQECIQRYGEPRVAEEFSGWWSPSAEDTHRIRAMLYHERYECQPSTHTQEHQYTLLRGESSVFTWLHSFPPTNPGSAAPPHSDVPNVMAPIDDEDTAMMPRDDLDATGDTSTETAPNGTVNDAMVTDEYAESDTNTSELVDELDRINIALRARSE
ncbi:hypothetical protein ARMSODRAFT_981156 [Armillaria solidipes]|uniref:Uncharacterized protein n=1 Tax=Armillaria solidipes TaxID=1076256 RepID=A0A2H3ATA4_9AGAR|nr:hypothetical protein ARMSODRAFT_981156 [Armillaria solidipes]